MPKYRVSFRTVADLGITIEADNEETAIEEAYQELPSGVCAQCSGWGRDWDMDMGDWQPADEAWPATPGYPAVEAVEK